jgi:hypothetical protein
MVHYEVAENIKLIFTEQNDTFKHMLKVKAANVVGWSLFQTLFKQCHVEYWNMKNTIVQKLPLASIW